jgi:hypothetical protein
LSLCIETSSKDCDDHEARAPAERSESARAHVAAIWTDPCTETEL